jgi:hypothetical protein
MDKGISVPVESCIRDIKSQDDDDAICMEFTEGWKPSDRFESDLGEEVYMSIDELADDISRKDKARLEGLRKLINDIRTDKKSA